MKATVLKSLLIVFFCFYASVSSYAQITVESALSEGNNSSSISSNARTADVTIFKDTLELPFFEDFTQATAPIDSILGSNGNPVEIRTLGHHGLKDQVKISLYQYNNASNPLNGNYYVQVIDKNTFRISSTPDLSSIVISDGSAINSNYARWTRQGASVGPHPDSLKWENGGGVYINNSFGLNPPSIYVATFDGLDGDGIPYSKIGKPRMETDYLTSQSFNFSGYTKDSNIVLSFHIQGKGLGFIKPERKDTLYLSFKDKDGVWNYIWGKIGDSSAFKQVQIPITNSKYFHNSFQFRFQYVCKTGDMGPSTNIDYIYLDRGWNTATNDKEKPRDGAISQSQSSILKNYRSIPYDQFALTDLADSVKFRVKNNMGAESRLVTEKYFKYSNGSTSSVEQITFGFLAKDTSYETGWKVDPNLIQLNGNPTTIQYNIQALTGDPSIVNGVRFNMNNTDSAKTILSDKLAYDDGSAESQMYLPNGGYLLIKFTLNNVPDTLTEIEIYNPKHYNLYDILQEFKYRNVTLMVTDDKKNSLVGNGVSTVLTYSDTINKLNRYVVDKKGIVINTKEFYVGFKQPNAVELPFGIDRNTKPTPSSVYVFNVATQQWIEQKFSGPILFHPVFGKPDAAVGVTESTSNNLTCELYPNPSRGELNIMGNISQLSIFSIDGKLMKFQSLNNLTNTHTLDINELPNGMYFVHLENETQKAIKKLIIAQ